LQLVLADKWRSVMPKPKTQVEDLDDDLEPDSVPAEPVDTDDNDEADADASGDSDDEREDENEAVRPA
jgi:hypothetical protein